MIYPKLVLVKVTTPPSLSHFNLYVCSLIFCKESCLFHHIYISYVVTQGFYRHEWTPAHVLICFAFPL